MKYKLSANDAIDNVLLEGIGDEASWSNERPGQFPASDEPTHLVLLAAPRFLGFLRAELSDGEQQAQKALADMMREELGAPVTIASRGQKIEVGSGAAV